MHSTAGQGVEICRKRTRLMQAGTLHPVPWLVMQRCHTYLCQAASEPGVLRADAYGEAGCGDVPQVNPVKAREDPNTGPM